MKKCIITILCTIFTSSLNSQTVSRFPIQPDAIWNMRYNGLYQEVFEYFIDKDTIINSQTYYKLYKSGVAYYETPFYYNNIYVGAIRDQDNKIYYIDKYETEESQLFNFDLELGDTIKSEIGKGKVITHIDTLPDGRKQYDESIEICVYSCPIVILIEGIGHAGGIMERPPDAHMGYAGYNLLCYLENNELVYHNIIGFEDNRCDTSSISESDCQINQVKIYPVPAKYILNIDFTDYQESEISFEIYNALGIVLLTSEAKIQSKNNNLSLDISNYGQGIYYIRIYNRNFNTTKQFIIK